MLGNREKTEWKAGFYKKLGVVAVSASVLFLSGFFYTCETLGKKVVGDRADKVLQSPNWGGDRFVNPQPLVNDLWGALFGQFSASPHSSPLEPVDTVREDPKKFRSLPSSGFRVTWLGHSSTLLELDGYKILTDPVWAERTSPVSWIGPKRWYSPLINLEDLPKIDFVLISHDHYDHLDHYTISKMKDWDTIFVVPLGVGENLEYWGVDKAKIRELDWWQNVKYKDLEIVSTPARHASGRYLLDNDKKLWSSYALIGPKHRVYFSGDTGLFPGMKKIGEKYGPFDLTMIETGQYDAAWPDWHIGPEQSVIAHQMLKGRILLPIHWGLFSLAFHGWTEPIERVLAKGKEVGAKVLTPRPGESFEPDQDPRFDRWWPNLPWRTGAENPIVSGQLDAEI